MCAEAAANTMLRCGTLVCSVIASPERRTTGPLLAGSDVTIRLSDERRVRSPGARTCYQWARPEGVRCVVPDDIILETHDLRMEFAGFVAVGGVDLRVERGIIHALIGPNGAGKTTVFNLLTKFLRPTHGRIVYNGRDITALAAADVARLGLVRSFQISAVFPHLTVLENVRVALQRKRGASFDFWRSKHVLDAFNDRALALIDDVGLAALRLRDRGGTALRPQARARDRDDAGARSRHAAARRADGGHGPRGHRPHQRADQDGLGRPHRADGRAQSQRGRRPLRHHHGAHARPRARRRRLRRRSRPIRRCAKPISGVGHA